VPLLTASAGRRDGVIANSLSFKLVFGSAHLFRSFSDVAAFSPVGWAEPTNDRTEA
jgi:hypothetical protein